MDIRDSPAVMPALLILLGAVAGLRLSYLPPSLLVCLLFASLALPGRGKAFCCLPLGLLAALLHGGVEPGAARDRPVELIARVVEHPILRDQAYHLRARSTHLRQGKTIETLTIDVRLTMPETATVPPAGSTVRVRGYLRRSVGFANGIDTPPGPWRLYLKSARFLSVVDEGGLWWRSARHWRGAVERRLDAFAETRPGVASGLVRALLLGDRSALSAESLQALRRVGLSHLLAISGLHLGLLAVIVWLALAPLPRRWRFLAVATVVLGYLAAVGPRPAMMRAAAMAVLAIVALWLERPPQALNSLAIGAAAMVLSDPAIVDDVGFRLSVAATAAILVLAPVLRQRWTLLPELLRQPLAITVAAQLGTLVFLPALTASLQPLAIFFNLLAVPWLTILLVVSFGWLLSAWVLGDLATAWVGPLLEVLAMPLAGLAALPASSLLWLPVAMTYGASLLMTALLVAVAVRPRALAPVLLAIALVAQRGGPPAPVWPELVMLDVGQGDATLLRDGKRALLIDGGGWRSGDFGGRVLVPALAALGVRRLDAVMLSHPDTDHCAGLVDVAAYLPIAEIWMAPGWRESCAASLATVPGARWRPLWRGDVVQMGRWRLQVLHPEPTERRGRNDRSLVVMAEANGRRVLLTGDISADIERRLVRHYSDQLAAEVLKVAHHGSASSTSRSFLEQVRPRLALISAGRDNVYGHPATEVVDRLSQAAMVTLRTDRSGRLRWIFLPCCRPRSPRSTQPPGGFLKSE